MPYRTPEEWTDMIMSSRLNIADLQQFGLVSNFETLELHVVNSNRDGVLAWIKDDLGERLIKNEDGPNAMHIASLEGKIEVLKYLIDKGGDPSSTTDHGYTPLVNAWRGQSAEACSVLLESGGDINCNYKDKPLILHILDSAKSDWNEERESAGGFLREIFSKTKIKVEIPSDYIYSFVWNIINSPVPYARAYAASTFEFVEAVIRLLDDSFDASRLIEDKKYNSIDLLSDLKLLDLSFYVTNLKKASAGDALICNESLRRFVEKYQSYKISKIIPQLVMQRVQSLNPTEDDNKLSIIDQETCGLKPELCRELLGFLSKQDACILGSVVNHLPHDDIVSHQPLEAAGGGGMEAKDL